MIPKNPRVMVVEAVAAVVLEKAVKLAYRECKGEVPHKLTTPALAQISAEAARRQKKGLLPAIPIFDKSAPPRSNVLSRDKDVHELKRDLER